MSKGTQNKKYMSKSDNVKYENVKSDSVKSNKVKNGQRTVNILACHFSLG